MNILPSPGSLGPAALIALLCVGCSTTTTTVKLTGSPGAQVKGHYRASRCTSDFAGTAAWQMDFSSQSLEEFEFQKAAVGQSVALEIRRGRKVLVQATAEPGTQGLRVRHAGNWSVETIP